MLNTCPAAQLEVSLAEYVSRAQLEVSLAEYVSGSSVGGVAFVSPQSLLSFIFALPNEALPVEHTINLITYKVVLLESSCALKKKKTKKKKKKRRYRPVLLLLLRKKERKVFGIVSIAVAMAADSIRNCFNRTLKINAQNRSNMRNFSFSRMTRLKLVQTPSK